MLRLRRYERISVQNRRFRSNGDGWPKISGRRGRPTKHSSSQKTSLNALSYGVKMWTDFSSVLLRSTRLLDGPTDRRTDRRTDGQHSRQRDKNWGPRTEPWVTPHAGMTGREVIITFNTEGARWYDLNQFKVELWIRNQDVVRIMTVYRSKRQRQDIFVSL